jgi:hypothetical protein
VGRRAMRDLRGSGFSWVSDIQTARESSGSARFMERLGTPLARIGLPLCELMVRFAILPCPESPRVSNMVMRRWFREDYGAAQGFRLPTSTTRAQRARHRREGSQASAAAEPYPEPRGQFPEWRGRVNPPGAARGVTFRSSARRACQSLELRSRLGSAFPCR